MNVKTATTAELIAKYNELTGKNIKKFSSREAGEKQVLKAMDAAAAANTGVRVIRISDIPAAQLKQQKTVKQPKTKQPKVAKEPSDRGAAIAASWKDPKVAAKRAERTHVKASDQIYRSVREAFEQLGLPLSKHIKFRMSLKEAHQMTFKHEGRSVTFCVVND